MPSLLQRVRWIGRSALSALFARFRSSPLALPAAEDSYPQRRAWAWPTRVEWYLGDIATAMRETDVGNLRLACQLCESMRVDGRISGLVSTRTNGLLALPRTISGSRGDTALVERFRKAFNKFARSTELAQMLADRLKIGIMIGEIVGHGRDMRIVRLLPEHVQITASTGEAHYNGELITPGDGRWIYITSSDITPWRGGIWAALARAFISKDHAYFLREGYSNKLANPARVATAPTGATDKDFEAWFNQVAGWGPDSVFAVRPGYQVSLVESNGTGFQVFQETMKAADEDVTMAISGQMLTADGAKGFVNMGIFQAIRNDLIHSDMVALCTGLEEQAIPWWQRENARSLLEHTEDLSVSFDTEAPEAKLARLNAKKLAIEVAQAARDSGIEDGQILADAGLVRMAKALPARGLQVVA